MIACVDVVTILAVTGAVSLALALVALLVWIIGV